MRLIISSTVITYSSWPPRVSVPYLNSCEQFKRIAKKLRRRAELHKRKTQEIQGDLIHRVHVRVTLVVRVFFAFVGTKREGLLPHMAAKRNFSPKPLWTSDAAPPAKSIRRRGGECESPRHLAVGVLHGHNTNKSDFFWAARLIYGGAAHGVWDKVSGGKMTMLCIGCCELVIHGATPHCLTVGQLGKTERDSPSLCPIITLAPHRMTMVRLNNIGEI